MAEMDVADVLEGAADALWMYGRTTTVGCNTDGNLCVLGAMRYARGLQPEQGLGSPGHWTNETETDAALALADRIPSSVHPIVGRRVYMWNDSLPVTPENDAHVIDTLRHCAKSIRNNATAGAK